MVFNVSMGIDQKPIPSVSPQLNIIVFPLQINAPPSQLLRCLSVHICINS